VIQGAVDTFLKIFILERRQIIYMSTEEYEVIPTSPIRRLEKRLEKMEDTSSTSQVQKLMEQVIELIKSNQRIIDDVVKANADLRDELGKIPGKIDKLMDTINDFMDILRTASEEEERAGVGPDAFKPLVDKLTQMVDQNQKSLEANQTMLTALETIDKRLKRLYMAFANMYRR
jgi:archaellum component FlaC